jgi:hypothetical protein
MFIPLNVLTLAVLQQFDDIPLNAFAKGVLLTVPDTYLEQLENNFYFVNSKIIVNFGLLCRQ